MQTNSSVFKAYDIRGVYGTDFDDELAYKLGLAFARLRRIETKKLQPAIVAARDMRLSSPALQSALIKGLVDGGAEVVDIGLASTPTFYFAVAHYGYDGGIQVSASHNPKDWNGFKLVRERALPIGGETGLFWLRDEILNTELKPTDVPGRVVKQENVLAEQVTHDLALVDTSGLKPFKVVIDPANAMGALYFDELFKHLPGEVVRINWELDGSFPAHEADPFKPENVKQICQKVLAEKADWGITTDGDADRIFFITGEGQAVEAGITRAILCRAFLADRPGAKIAYDIRPGRITRDAIVEAGGVPVVTRVGHSLIKAQTVAEGAYFAGESSGHFFLNMPEGCYEVPMVVALKMWQVLSLANQPLSEYIKPYQKYWHSGEINIPVKDIEETIRLIRSHYRDGQQNELDGISVEYNDFWFNVRASNTEPLVRLNLEAVSQELMVTKRDELIALLKSMSSEQPKNLANMQKL